MQHVTQHIETIDEDALNEGFMFDGSSIAGWKAINESDMTLMPDLDRAYIDGESALIGLTRIPPDLAVIDIKMPKMDGEEL